MATAATRARLRAVLIDLSGTIHIDDLAIPGAIEAVQRLRKTSVKVKFVTNTTKESLGTLHDRLTRIGFDIQQQEMFTSLTAASNLLKELGCRPMLLLQDDAKQDFKDICTDDPNSVVVGLSPDCFKYETMNTAFRLVLEGSPLIAIHKARFYKRPDGLALGPGPFVEALEYATGVKASIVGKPETTFFMKALEELGCTPEEAVMIGDDVQGDVGGAQRAGIKGFLVKTGKYRPKDEEKISPPPVSVCEDFPAVVELLIKDYL